jgi:hypothetical protein
MQNADENLSIDDCITTVFSIGLINVFENDAANLQSRMQEM